MAKMKLKDIQNMYTEKLERVKNNYKDRLQELEEQNVGLKVALHKSELLVKELQKDK